MATFPANRALLGDPAKLSSRRCTLSRKQACRADWPAKLAARRMCASARAPLVFARKLARQPARPPAYRVVESHDWLTARLIMTVMTSIMAGPASPLRPAGYACANFTQKGPRFAPHKSSPSRGSSAGLEAARPAHSQIKPASSPFRPPGAARAEIVIPWSRARPSGEVRVCRPLAGYLLYLSAGASRGVGQSSALHAPENPATHSNHSQPPRLLVYPARALQGGLFGRTVRSVRGLCSSSAASCRRGPLKSAGYEGSVVGLGRWWLRHSRSHRYLCRRRRSRRCQLGRRRHCCRGCCCRCCCCCC